jgi:hypothetical protein
MTTYYVELVKKVYYFGEIQAGTQEEAENEIIKFAGGNPQDWEIIRSEESAVKDGKGTDINVEFCGR